MGFVVEGSGKVGGEARRESFYLHSEDQPRDQPFPEFCYEDIPDLLVVIEQIKATKSYQEWKVKHWHG